MKTKAERRLRMYLQVIGKMHEFVPCDVGARIENLIAAALGDPFPNDWCDDSPHVIADIEAAAKQASEIFKDAD